MAGLILLVVVAGFIALLVFLSRQATQSLALSAEAKTALRWLIVIGAFPLMVADEIVGKYQFEALCDANGIQGVDVSKARGKRVKIQYSERRLVEKTIMPIKTSDVFFRDVDNGEVLIHHQNYYAVGGWLMRYTPLSMGSPQPMLFHGNGCGFKNRDEIFVKNKILQVN